MKSGSVKETRIDDLSDSRIKAFLDEHIRDMRSVSPPESKRALDIESLRKPDITFWGAWQEEENIGCGALRKLDSTHAEIKAMNPSSFPIQVRL